MKRILITLLTLALTLPLIACSGAATDATPQVTSADPPKIPSIEIYGKVGTSDSQHISFKQSFLVENVLVQPGQHLMLNDPIAKINLKQQEDELTLLKLQIEQLEKQLSSGNTAYQQSLQAVKSAELRESQAQEFLRTQEALYQASSISKNDFEQAKNAHINAQQDVVQARANAKGALQSGSQSVSSTSLELERIKMQYDQLVAFIESPYFSNSYLINPLDVAVVSAIGLKNGMYTLPQESLISLDLLNSLVIHANVSEEYLKEISLGKTVSIKPLMSPEETLEGTISFISAKAQVVGNETMIPIQITFKEKSTLLPNLNVDITVGLGD